LHQDLLGATFTFSCKAVFCCFPYNAEINTESLFVSHLIHIICREGVAHKCLSIWLFLTNENSGI